MQPCTDESKANIVLCGGGDSGYDTLTLEGRLVLRNRHGFAIAREDQERPITPSRSPSDGARTSTARRRRANAPVVKLLLALSACLFIGNVQAGEATNPVAVPFKLQRGRVMIPARVNGSEPFSFMLDTGFSITTVHPALAEQLDLRQAGRVTIVGIAGEEEAPMYAGVVFDFGGASYAPRRVASLPSERNRWRRQDGVLGSGLLRRFVMEIDGEAKLVRLYEPTNFVYSGHGEILPLRFRKDTPAVEATIGVPDRLAIKGEFEIDTGCDSGLCLGHPFVEKNQLLAATETRDSAKFGVGGGASTRSGHVAELRLGRFTVDRPQTDFFVEGSPVSDPFAGHIGMGVLREFKVIFDFSRKQLILER